MKIVTYSRLNFYHLWVKNLRKYTTKSLESSDKWCPVIGLEIHAQIDTESKLFSGASTRFGASVNSCVSLFDCATPGTLPGLTIPFIAEQAVMKNARKKREAMLERKRRAEKARYQRIKNNPVKYAEQKEKERRKYLRKKALVQEKIAMLKKKRDEMLEKKRIAERARYQNIKNDPAKLAEQRIKERLKYLRKKEQSRANTATDMTVNELGKTRVCFGKNVATFFEVQRNLHDITNNFVIVYTSEFIYEKKLCQEKQKREENLEDTRKFAEVESPLKLRKNDELIQKKNGEIKKLQKKLQIYAIRLYHQTMESTPVIRSEIDSR